MVLRYTVKLEETNTFGFLSSNRDIKRVLCKNLNTECQKTCISETSQVQSQVQKSILSRNTHIEGMAEGYFSTVTETRGEKPKVDLTCAPVHSAWWVTNLKEEWYHVKYWDE